MKKLQIIWEELSTSFWFVPILMLMITIISAISLIYLDSKIQYSPEGIIKYLLPATVDSARIILTIIAGAMIGVAGTVFSITLVVLTLASSQLGSRLVRNFMYDKLNQVVLGLYISSFVYCLILLSAIKEDTDLQFVPAISAIVALALAIAGMILLIIYIHHVSISIQVDKVISDIAVATLKSARNLFPAEIGKEVKKQNPDIGSLQQKYILRIEVRCKSSGYLISIDGQGLLDIALDNDSIIVLQKRPGNYLVKDMVVCEVLCNEELSKKVYDKIQEDFILGKVRNPLQDTEFLIHEMVEIAARALPPGMNDPYTAIACIDNLTSVMCYLTSVKFPSPYRYDLKDNLRLIAGGQNFSGMLDAAFNQLRQYAETNPSVMIRLMEATHTISTYARDKTQQELLVKHAEMIMNAAEKTFSEKHDLEDMKERFRTLKGVNLPGE